MAGSRGHEGMTGTEPTIKARGRPKKGRGPQPVESVEVPAFASITSHNPAKPRRSPRIAALNPEQKPSAPANQGSKVAKRSEKPPARTRRKTVANREKRKQSRNLGNDPHKYDNRLPGQKILSQGKRAVGHGHVSCYNLPTQF